MSTTELVEVEVTFQGRRQERGLLGVQGVLWDGAGGRGGGCGGQVQGVTVGVIVGVA